MPLAPIVAHWMTSWPIAVPVAEVWTGLGTSDIQHHSTHEIEAHSTRRIRRRTTRRTTTRR